MLSSKKAKYQSIDSNYDLSEISYSGAVQHDQQRPPDQITIRDKERVYWLPWLLLVFVLCFFYFLSMLYSVRLMSEYEDSPLRFELIQWSIFLVPSVMIGFLVITPFPSALRRARHSLSGKKPPSGYLPTINILNAVFCLLAVALYLNLSAFPDYRNSRWNTDVQYQERLPIPSFARIFMDDRSNTND